MACNTPQIFRTVAAFRKQKSSRQTTEKMKTRLQTPTNMLAARNESLVRLAKSMKSPRQLYSPPTCSRSQYSYRPKNPTPGEVSVSPSHWGWMKATAFKITKQADNNPQTTVTTRRFLRYVRWCIRLYSGRCSASWSIVDFFDLNLKTPLFLSTKSERLFVWVRYSFLTFASWRVLLTGLTGYMPINRFHLVGGS